MSGMIDKQSAIDVIIDGCEEWKGIADRIVDKINELPTVELNFSLYSAEVEEEYMKAKLDTRIKKPLAYALHRVWQKHSGEDKK